MEALAVGSVGDSTQKKYSGKRNTQLNSRECRGKDCLCVLLPILANL